MKSGSEFRSLGRNSGVGVFWNRVLGVSRGVRGRVLGKRAEAGSEPGESRSLGESPGDKDGFVVSAKGPRAWGGVRGGKDRVRGVVLASAAPAEAEAGGKLLAWGELRSVGGGIRVEPSGGGRRRGRGSRPGAGGRRATRRGRCRAAWPEARAAGGRGAEPAAAVAATPVVRGGWPSRREFPAGGAPPVHCGRDPALQ